MIPMIDVNTIVYTARPILKLTQGEESTAYQVHCCIETSEVNYYMVNTMSESAGENMSFLEHTEEHGYSWVNRPELVEWLLTIVDQAYDAREEAAATL